MGQSRPPQGPGMHAFPPEEQLSSRFQRWAVRPIGKAQSDPLASIPLGDANRGAFLALQSAVSTRRRPVATDPPERRAFSCLQPGNPGPEAGATVAAGLVQRVLLASPRGYCAGVERAVETVERALSLYGAPVYVRKQIVHNAHVVRDLEGTRRHLRRRRDRGPGRERSLVLSAHGVAPVGLRARGGAQAARRSTRPARS